MMHFCTTQLLPLYCFTVGRDQTQHNFAPAFQAKAIKLQNTRSDMSYLSSRGQILFHFLREV